MSVNLTEPQNDHVASREDTAVAQNCQGKNSILSVLLLAVANRFNKVTITPPLRQMPPQSTAGNTKTFHKFANLPLELQIKIFKYALPDSRIVYFGIKISTAQDWNKIRPRLDIEIAAFPGVLPLLQTCTTSNASVYSDGGFSKIKVEPLGTNPVFFPQPYRNSNIPIYYEIWHHKVRNYTFLRPSQDILLLDTPSLMMLYRFRGSLNLQNITHISITEIDLTFPSNFSKIYFLNFIQAQCPGLERLSYIPGPCNIRGWHYHKLRFLEINNNLLNLNFRDSAYREVPERSESQMYRALSTVLNRRRRFSCMIEDYHSQMAQEDNKDSIAYWKEVEVVDVLVCWSEHLGNESYLYFPYLEAYVDLNNDGTLAALRKDAPDNLLKLRNDLRSLL